MIKKKITLLALLMILALVLVGCNSGGQSAGSSQSESSGNQAAQETEEKEEQGEVKFERAIEIKAGGGPGGGTDTFSRAIARELSDILGVPVNVVNIPGAAGAVASQELAAAPADGYSIMPTTSDFQINIAAGKTPNYLEQFDALARIHEDTYSILVKAGSEYADINALIAAAKEKPGEIVIGGTSSKGLDELTVAQFEEMAGIDLNYTPYEEAGKMAAAVLGGHIDAVIDEIGPNIALVEGGQLEASVIFRTERLEQLPDVPTTVENGWDVTTGMSRGFLIHKDAPAELKAALEDALKQAIASERYQEFAKEGFLHLKDGWLNSSEYKEFLQKEVDDFTAKLAE
ncbi:tripartite tricarboxylate transporter substrate binding protein [Bacillus sp. Marseille-P3661]|uniref:tripartite tricarboxylate transporter substrate binding protein n=1 Tax=Bacillus sp. Marseille-P3661 TaxID=1936234 RepID=UPI000C84E06A|nr:tripartite tricarboxylate transporter substrate binding protein [Bacillus sp. Marseille-P3661]